MDEDSGGTPATERWISGREAADLLAGIGVSRRHARRLLATGIAGAPVRLRGVTLFDAARVTALLSWPVLGREACVAACPHGVMVLRREVSVLVPFGEQLAAVSDGWDTTPWTWIDATLRMARGEPFPVVVTVAGFVLLGADRLRGWGRLELVEAGPWFEQVRGHRLPTGPGKPWCLVRYPLG